MKQKIIILFSSLTLIFLAILYGVGFFNKSSSVSFKPQTPQLFSVGLKQNNQLNILATTLPQFALSLVDSQFNNLWQANAQEKNSVSAQVTNLTGETVIPVATQIEDTKKQVIFTPQTNNQFKPGLYTLNVKVKTVSGKDITITQDFTWGVLAINTGKAIYQPGETVKIGMGVLDDLGNTKCIATADLSFTTARVWLTIISPSGKEQELSTSDGTIVGSKECSATSVTNNPDFQTTFVPSEVGRYTMHMTAENINGKRSIDDYFTVSKTPPAFDIMRTSYPTRIYPYGHYPVEITIVANQDYAGEVSDQVPSSFIIGNISDGGSLSKPDDYSRITWNVNWQKNHTYTLRYEIQFPHISPEFYLVGPLTIGIFSEGREWQIASDAISQVHEDSNVANSGTTVAVTWPSIVANHLEVQICMETGSATISTPTRGSGSPRPNSWSTAQSVTTTPRIAMFYRNSTVNDNLTFTCTFSSSTGVKAIIVYEYSGIATSTQRDGHSSLSASTVCNGGPPFQATVPLTATNGNELVLSAQEATTARTVNSHSAGFNQEFAFNGSSGTFTSASQIIALSGSYPDTATLSGSGGTCSGVNVSFITPITVTQNGYQFFNNANSITPGSAIGTQNTDLTLAFPHSTFRLRMLLDIDSNQTLAIGAGDWILQYAVSPTNGDCSTLQDSDWDQVTSSTPIAWNVNSLSGGSNTNISSATGDPTDTSPHAYTDTYENYYESFNGTGTDDVSNVQAALSNNLAGVFDFSLVDNSGDTVTTTFCLELVNADGAGNVSSNLDSYLHYPQVTTFFNEVNIQGPGNAGGTTVIKGPGTNGGSTIIN